MGAMLTLAGAFICGAPVPRGPVARQGPLRSGFSLSCVNLHSETSPHLWQIILDLWEISWSLYPKNIPQMFF